jgi:hypothetical protein
MPGNNYAELAIQMGEVTLISREMKNILDRITGLT